MFSATIFPMGPPGPIEKGVSAAWVDSTSAREAGGMSYIQDYVGLWWRAKIEELVRSVLPLSATSKDLRNERNGRRTK